MKNIISLIDTNVIINFITRSQRGRTCWAVHLKMSKMGHFAVQRNFNYWKL